MMILELFLLANLATAASASLSAPKPGAAARVMVKAPAPTSQSWLSRRSPPPPSSSSSPPPPSSAVSKKLPKKLTDQPVEWKTSKTHGWIGSKKAPNRDGIPDPTVPEPRTTRKRVVVRAKGIGPATLDGVRGKYGENNPRPAKRFIYRFEDGQPFNKKFTNPDYVTLNAWPYHKDTPDSKTGTVNLEATGARSHARVQGEKLGPEDAAEAVGQGPEGRVIQRGKRKATTYFEKGFNITPPPENPRLNGVHPDDTIFKTLDVEQIRKSSRTERVTTAARVQGGQVPDYTELTVTGSNWPSHSPPTSPERASGGQK